MNPLAVNLPSTTSGPRVLTNLNPMRTLALPTFSTPSDEIHFGASASSATPTNDEIQQTHQELSTMVDGIYYKKRGYPQGGQEELREKTLALLQSLITYSESSQTEIKYPIEEIEKIKKSINEIDRTIYNSSQLEQLRKHFPAIEKIINPGKEETEKLDDQLRKMVPTSHHSASENTGMNFGGVVLGILGILVILVGGQALLDFKLLKACEVAALQDQEIKSLEVKDTCDALVKRILELPKSEKSQEQ